MKKTCVNQWLIALFLLPYSSYAQSTNDLLKLINTALHRYESKALLAPGERQNYARFNSDSVLTKDLELHTVYQQIEIDSNNDLNVVSCSDMYLIKAGTPASQWKNMDPLKTGKVEKYKMNAVKSKDVANISVDKLSSSIYLVSVFCKEGDCVDVLATPDFPASRTNYFCLSVTDPFIANDIKKALLDLFNSVNK